MMDMIRADLALLGIHHDLFSSEAALQAAGKPEAAEAWLRAHDLVYDGVLEAPKGKTARGLGAGRAAAVPLDQVRRRPGPADPQERRQLDLFRRRPRLSPAEGRERRRADRHLGRRPRRHGQADQGRGRGAVEGEGKPIPFDVKLVQMVQLLRDGEPAKMSKRSGNFVTIADMVEEVGKDVVRFTMLTRKPEAQMDFDFAKVVEASKDNPVFYVQYAHARIRSTLRKAAPKGCARRMPRLALLGAERARADQAGRAVPADGRRRRRRRASRTGSRSFLYDLAAAFHAYWNLGNDDPTKRFILTEEPELTGGRLFLGDANRAGYQERPQPSRGRSGRGALTMAIETYGTTKIRLQTRRDADDASDSRSTIGTSTSWLEGDDDYEPQGVDTARIAAFAIIGLLDRRADRRRIWWFARDKTERRWSPTAARSRRPKAPTRKSPTIRAARNSRAPATPASRSAKARPRRPDRRGAKSRGRGIDTHGASPVRRPRAAVGGQVGAYSVEGGRRKPAGPKLASGSNIALLRGAQPSG